MIQLKLAQKNGGRVIAHKLSQLRLVSGWNSMKLLIQASVLMIPVPANTTTENHTCADVYGTYC